MGKNNDTTTITNRKSKKRKKKNKQAHQSIGLTTSAKTIRKTTTPDSYTPKRNIKHPEECDSIGCTSCNTAFYRRKKTLLKKAEALNRKFPDAEVLVVITSRRKQNKLFSFSSEKFEPITTTPWGLRLFEDHLNPPGDNKTLVKK